MDIYKYSEHDGAYTETIAAKQSPLEENVYLIPAFATDIKIPPFVTGQTVPKFSNGSWTIVDDYRGKVAWDNYTAEEVTIKTIGSLSPALTLVSPEGVKFPLWNISTWIEDRVPCFEYMVEEIEKKKREANLADFVYNGNTYKSDKESIQATQNQALGGDPVASILTLRGTPYEGSWDTLTGFIPYTNEEFIQFATEYFKRGSDNHTTRSLHIMALEGILNDAVKPASDLLKYDYSTGWH